MERVGYRVAIASTDGRNVDQHFGRCECFLIVDVDEDGSFEEIEARYVTPVCMGGYHDQDKLKKGAEALLDCNFVLAAKIGPGAMDELEERGIAAFQIPGPVAASLGKLDKYLKLLETISVQL